jgi:hypothetical protein
MLTAILEHIIGYTHYSKIETKEDLVRETWWDGIGKWSSDILKLIWTCHPTQCPAPALVLIPLPCHQNPTNFTPSTNPSMPLQSLLLTFLPTSTLAAPMTPSPHVLVKKEHAKTSCHACDLKGHNHMFLYLYF